MGDAPSTVKSYGTLVTEIQEQYELKDIVRQFLESVEEELRPGNCVQDSEAAQEVLFDIQIDDSRYILTRLYPQTSQVQVNLSPREQEIVRLVAKGHPNKIIATVLEISPWTVSTHLRRVFAKLGGCSRAEMVARILEADLFFSLE